MLHLRLYRLTLASFSSQQSLWAYPWKKWKLYSRLVTPQIFNNLCTKITFNTALQCLYRPWSRRRCEVGSTVDTESKHRRHGCATKFCYVPCRTLFIRFHFLFLRINENMFQLSAVDDSDGKCNESITKTAQQVDSSTTWTNLFSFCFYC